MFEVILNVRVIKSSAAVVTQVSQRICHISMHRRINDADPTDTESDNTVTVN